MGRYYEPKDYDAIQFWLDLRRLPAPSEKYIPKVGWFVAGVACGFLYQTDSSIAILDTFITNPRADKSARQNGLKEVAEKLMDTATRLGFTDLKCDTQIKSIEELAKSLGFQPTGTFQTLMKEL